jgi:hypothetical protein
MRKPYGSILDIEYRSSLEAKPIKSFEPSKGGMGIRLKAASITLMLAKCWSTSTPIRGRCSPTILKQSSERNARQIFAIGFQ